MPPGICNWQLASWGRCCFLNCVLQLAISASRNARDIQAADCATHEHLCKWQSNWQGSKKPMTGDHLAQLRVQQQTALPEGKRAGLSRAGGFSSIGSRSRLPKSQQQLLMLQQCRLRCAPCACTHRLDAVVCHCRTRMCNACRLQVMGEQYRQTAGSCSNARRKATRLSMARPDACSLQCKSSCNYQACCMLRLGARTL